MRAENIDLSPTIAIPPCVRKYHEAIKAIEEAHLNGSSGSQTLTDITAATDALLIGVLKEKIIEHGLDPGRVEEGMCLVALGGYGRKEMHPQSDIDIMFLFPYQPDREAEHLVSDMVRTLFDARLRVGNVTRDFATAYSIARNDLESLTAMFEGRLIWGNLTHYERFHRQLASYAKRNSRRLIAGKIAERNRRL